MLPLLFSPSVPAPWCRDLSHSGSFPPQSHSPPPLPAVSRAGCSEHELVAPQQQQQQSGHGADAAAELYNDGQEAVRRWLWQQRRSQPPPQAQPQQQRPAYPQQAAAAGGASAVYHQLQFEMQPGAKVKPSSHFVQPALLYSASSSPLSSPSASELELEIELLDRLCSEQSEYSSGSSRDEQLAPLPAQLLPLLRGSWTASASLPQPQPMAALQSLPLPGLSLLPLESLALGTEVDRCGRLPLLWLQRDEKEVRVKREGEAEAEEEESKDGCWSDDAAGSRSLLAPTALQREPETPQRLLDASTAAAASKRGRQSKRARRRAAHDSLKRSRQSHPGNSAAPAVSEPGSSSRKQRKQREQDGCDSSSSSSSPSSSSSSGADGSGSESEEDEQPGSASRRRRPPSAASSSSSAGSSESRPASPAPSRRCSPAACSSSSSSSCSLRAAYPHSKLLPAATRALRRFFLQHILYPFPSEAEKAALQWRAGLSRKQVCDWFTNNRKRYWRPYELRMTRLGCNLVRGSASQSRQQPQQRAGRCAVAYNDGVKRRCRCGSNHSALHRWRDMWD